MLDKVVRLGNKFQNPVPTSVGTGSIPFKVLWRYLTKRAEREPSRPLDRLSPIRGVYTTPPLSGLRVTWFGHSSMLVEIDGARVLVDPVWEQRASPSEWIGPKRFLLPLCAWKTCRRSTWYCCPHDHFDHFGAHTIRRLARLNATKGAQWVATLGVDQLLQKLGVSHTHALDWTESLQVGPLTSPRCPARHFSGRSLF